MTKDEKIEEVMELVSEHAYVYLSAATGQGLRDSDDVKELESAIESKLRELIQ